MLTWFRVKQPPAQDESSQNITLKKHLNQIQSLTGVTPADFHLLYVSTINRFIDYLAQPNQSSDESTIHQALNHAILALKRRQGYLLPVGADSEVAFREREEWTFAVFSAALFVTLEVSIRLVVAKAILPKAGFAWLHRNPALFRAWQQYLSGDSEPSIFNELICPVSSKKEETSAEKVEDGGQAIQQHHAAPVTQKTDETSFFAPDQIAEQPAIPQQPTNEEATSTKNAVIQEIDLTQVATAPLNEPPEHAINQTLPTFQADDFWQWLLDAILNNQITLNQPSSSVHGVEGGLLIGIPQALDEFLSSQARQRGLKTVPTITLNQRIQLTKDIKKHAKLVRTAQGSRIHAYYWGKWEERRVISGVVIQYDTLFKDNRVVPINTALMIDPISAA